MNRSVIALMGPAIVLVLAITLRGEEPPAPVGLAQKQTVVLRNGRVLQGLVARREDRLEVSASGQSVVRIQVSLVDFVAPDLQTAYQHQADRLKDDDIDARIRLVEWSLQNDLLREAAQQYAVVRYLEPDHPKFKYLTRRLELSQRARSMIRVASASSKSDSSEQRPVTPAELSRFTKQMPAGTVEQFTHVIQPMIVNRCGAAACHGVRGETAYQLVQPSMAGAFSHRYTQRNLYSTVQEIRQGNLANSAWIAAATQPHGGLKKPLFGEKEIDNLQNLVAWARSVGPAPCRLNAAAIAAAQLTTPPQPERRDAGVRQASFSEPATGKQRGFNPDAPVDPPTPKTANAADPFDPGSFNQKKK